MPVASVKDVAARARVSPGTVSNFLNHPGKVAPETAARIHKAIKELGYVGNPAARALRTGESATIAHVTYEVGNPFFADFSNGVQAAAADRDYEVVIANTSGSLEREAVYLDLFRAQKVRGLLLSPLGDVRHHLEEYRRAGIPVVLVDRHPTGAESTSVSIDDMAGGRLAVEHLVATGRKRLAFVGGPMEIDAVADRFEGARQAALLAGASIEVVPTNDRTIREGRTVGAALAARDDLGFDGLFAANDLLAIGLLHGLLAGGTRVPDEVAIVGYDDIDFAADAILPLTTVRRPAELFGRTALDLLHKSIVTGTGEERVVFQPQLIARSTTPQPRS